MGVVFGFWFYGIPAGWVHRYLHSAAVSNLIGFLLVFWTILAIGALFAKVTCKTVQMDRAFLARPLAREEPSGWCAAG